MARVKGGDRPDRKKGSAKGHSPRGRRNRARQVYIFTEGEVTEPEYIDIILREGDPQDPTRKVERRFRNASAVGKHRKPLPMVKDAVSALRKVEREAKDSGLTEEDWNWPQVWVLFDRDDHQGIPEAMKLAEQAGVQIAYSHPCFELWRLLHYKNHTSRFGRGSCQSANAKLREQSAFRQTYGKNTKSVSEQQSKRMQPEQVLGGDRYAAAKGHAQKLNKAHTDGNPNSWDTYTDVWRFVEEGLLLSSY